ncbi:MAG: hypothetical protein JW862_03065, partial [Anaerolineales bacterium]|nr:hypothetical protein [Anaerolineales bacterium]
TGNEMSPAGVAALSAQVNLPALRAYRLAVGQRTRQIIQALTPEQLKHRVDPERIQRVHTEGAILPSASDISAYWSKRTIAGLLLMPATRHNFVHLNEIAALKKRHQ